MAAFRAPVRAPMWQAVRHYSRAISDTMQAAGERLLWAQRVGLLKSPCAICVLVLGLKVWGAVKKTEQVVLASLCSSYTIILLQHTP